MDKFPITTAGYKKMEEEVKRLKTVERPAITLAIAEAREHGDLKENAEYHAAREQQSLVEGRIIELEDKIARAEVIDPTTMSGDTVRFGATVQVVDEESDEEATYIIVGTYESNIERNMIANTAPIARAFIGKSVGDSVKVDVPGGTKYYEILHVEYKHIEV